MPVLRRVKELLVVRHRWRVGVGKLLGVLVVGCPATELNHVGSAHRGRTVHNVRHRQSARVVDAHPPALSLFRRHENHAVGTARTVDGRRRGVLQYVDRLNVARVQRLNGRGRHQGYSVHNIQGGVARPDTALTANHNAPQLAGALVRRDVYTGGLALQCLQGVVHRAGVQLLGSHARHGARHVALFLNAVTHHNNLTQLLAVLLQRYVQRGLAAHGHGLRRVAYIRDDQTGLLRHVRQGEVTVEIGHRTRRRSFHHDARTDDGLTGGVDNRTRNLRLRKGHSGAKHHEGEEEKALTQ